LAGFLKLELTAKLKTPPKHRLKEFRPEFSTDISMAKTTCSPLTSAMECNAVIISHDSDSERAAKKARTVGRSIVDSVHMSALISSYNQGCSNIRFGEFEFPKRQKIRFESDSYEFEFELPFRNSIRAN
jgi:hypothetical protein